MHYTIQHGNKRQKNTQNINFKVSSAFIDIDKWIEVGVYFWSVQIVLRLAEQLCILLLLDRTSSTGHILHSIMNEKAIAKYTKHILLLCELIGALNIVFDRRDSTTCHSHTNCSVFAFTFSSHYRNWRHLQSVPLSSVFHWTRLSWFRCADSNMSATISATFSLAGRQRVWNESQPNRQLNDASEGDDRWRQSECHRHRRDRPMSIVIGFSWHYCPKMPDYANQSYCQQQSPGTCHTRGDIQPRENRGNTLNSEMVETTTSSTYTVATCQYHASVANEREKANSR